MYDGVKAMIMKEKELRPAQPKVEPKVETKVEPVVEVPVKCGPHLKKTEDLTGFPEFPAGTKSLVSKHLTKEVWDQLKDAKDD